LSLYREAFVLDVVCFQRATSYSIVTRKFNYFNSSGWFWGAVAPKGKFMQPLFESFAVLLHKRTTLHVERLDDDELLPFVLVT
jgi:hypothetical protein